MISKIDDKNIRGRLLGSISQMSQASISNYLTASKEKGLIFREELNARKNIRHHVAHGNLFEPWGTPEDSESLENLLRLFYKLTSIRIRYAINI